LSQVADRIKDSFVRKIALVGAYSMDSLAAIFYNSFAFAYNHSIALFPEKISFNGKEIVQEAAKVGAKATVFSLASAIVIVASGIGILAGPYKVNFLAQLGFAWYPVTAGIALVAQQFFCAKFCGTVGTISGTIASMWALYTFGDVVFGPESPTGFSSYFFGRFAITHIPFAIFNGLASGIVAAGAETVRQLRKKD
jgi:hypothetical protein